MVEVQELCLRVLNTRFSFLSFETFTFWIVCILYLGWWSCEKEYRSFYDNSVAWAEATWEQEKMRAAGILYSYIFNKCSCSSFNY